MIVVKQVKGYTAWHTHKKGGILVTATRVPTTYRLLQNGKTVDSFLSKRVAMCRARTLADGPVQYIPNKLAAYA